MPAAKKPVEKDIAFTLPKGTTPFKVVSVLQEQFKSPATEKDGKVIAPRKLQGRLLIGAVVEAVFQHASAETLSKLAAEVKDKGDGDKKGKASEYIAAIAAARAAAPAAAAKPAEELSVEELEAIIARKKAAQAPGGKTKDVAAL